MLKRRILTVLALAAAMMLLSAMTVLAGHWYQDNNGYWYEFSDGSYAVGDIYSIDGEYYIFDGDGYLITNTWIGVGLYDAKWYYCTSGGEVARNCWIGDYYVGSDGAMLTNTYTPDGYYVGDDGRWVASTGLDAIPLGDYSSVGYNGDTVNYRVDGFMYEGYQGKTLDFGHYESSGSPYDFYSKTNPNGDTLVLYESGGQIYGKSTKNDKSYEIDYDGTKLKIYWVNTTWNGGSTIILAPTDYGYGVG